MLRHTFRLGARRFIPGYILLLLMVCLVLQPKIQQDGGSISCKKPFTAFGFSEDLELALEAKKLQVQHGNNTECLLKWEKRGKAAYTQQHIDEVRNE
ncbi:uncharacterized protein LOC133745161 isoform X2 [Rosa rugosa]|uniref:uncharacterized protein LOC133745161 isoform X2 n=1 Tax=Rosa rugosa TaxID=74645 RepID=UPI002B40BD4E|nr:uncharacterized protein LOC133745161 isoform X2 [Rosa rugosa]